MKKRFTPLAAAFLVGTMLCGCSTGTEQAVSAAPTQAAQEQAAPQSSQDGMESAASLILDIPTTQYFTDEAVDPEDIDTILLAGANAPSAMNGQPWHFSAITDSAVIEEISGGMSFGGPPAGMTGMPEGAPADGEMPEMPEGAMPEMPEGAEPPEGMGQMPFAPSADGAMPAPPTGGGTAKAGIEDAPLVIVVSCKAGSEFDAGLACQNMSAEAQLLGYGTKIVSAPTMAINAEGQEALRAALGMPEGYTACALLLVGRADTTVDTTADTYTSATTRNPLSDVVTYLNP